MTKKILSAILVFTMMAAMLSGCGLFTSGGNEGGPSGSAGDIKMTDSYTFKDPAGLEYETRYVLYCDENSSFVSTAASYGMQAMYSIMYADGKDAPVGYYEFMICDTPENAQAVIELYTSFGSSVSASEEDPCIVYSSTDADSVEAMLISFQSMGVISEATVSAYMEYYKTANGGTIME